MRAEEIFVIGRKLRGRGAILCSLDGRVKKVIANCPVVDWAILSREQRKETSNPSYAAYIREAFGTGTGCRIGTGKNFATESSITPLTAREITGAKILMFHAQDDPYVPYQTVVRFAKRTGAKLKLFRRGGHLSTDRIVRKYWAQIGEFFAS